MALATFLQLLRPQTLQEQRAIRGYRAQVQQMADRLQAIFDEWGALREVEPDYARLANAAAVNRWELMRMARDANELEPPRSLANVHRDVQNAVDQQRFLAVIPAAKGDLFENWPFLAGVDVAHSH